MAYIQEKTKGKKIVSFKIKAYVGRDANGKQIFKCTTWYPPEKLTPARTRKEAQKAAGGLEDEVRQRGFELRRHHQIWSVNLEGLGTAC